MLAGNFYHEQLESVPEQTWSSAGLLDAAVRGLLGLEVHGAEHRIEFAPHLPAQWEQTSIDNVRVGGGTLGLALTQKIDGLRLELRNSGVPVKLLFKPQIPLGARLIGARFQDRAIHADMEVHPEDEQANLSLDVPPGVSRCEVDFEGGLSLLSAPMSLHPGDASTGTKLIHARVHDHTLVIDAEVNAQSKSTLAVRTSWKLAREQGAHAEPAAGSLYRITLLPGAAQSGASGYTRAHAELTFAP